jgi:flavoprotein
MEILKEEEQRYIEELVRRIVSEVLKKAGYSEASKEEEYKTPGKEESPGNILVVFTGGTGSLDAVAEELGKLSGKYKLYAVFSEMAKKVLPQEKLKKNARLEEVCCDGLYEAIDKSRIVVLPTLTQNTAAKIACGIRDTVATEAVAVAILAGKKILACEDSIPFAVKNQGYFKVIDEIVRKLKEFGIIFCKAQKMSEEVESLICGSSEMNNLLSKKECEYENKSTEITIDSKLITGEIIQKLYGEGIRKIKLPSKCIITPAARDMIKDYKITLNWMV